MPNGKEVKIRIAVDGREGKVVFDDVNQSVKKTTKSVEDLSTKLKGVDNALSLIKKNDAFSKMQSKVRSAIQSANTLSSSVDDISVSTKKTADSTSLLSSNFLKLGAGYFTVRKISDTFWRGVEAIDAFDTSIVSNAATIVTLQKNVEGLDLATRYKLAKEQAAGIVPVLEDIAAKTLLSGDQVRVLNDAFLRGGQVLDINNKNQIQGIQNISNALKILLGSNADERQIRQEIGDLIEGQITQASTLGQFLKSALNPELKAQGITIKEQLATWKEQGVLIEEIGNVLNGVGIAADDLEDSWSAVSSTLDTTVNQLLREGMKPIYGELIKLTKDYNEGLKQTQGLVSTWASGLGIVLKATRDFVAGESELEKQAKNNELQFVRTNETIQKAVTYWQQQGVAQDVINQRVQQMVDNFKGLNTETQKTATNLEATAQKTELIAQGTVKVAENVGRIETTNDGILLTNKSMEQLAESTKKTVVETTKLPDNYQILGKEVNGVVTLTNKYQNATREAERTAGQNNETTQESIDKLKELASGLDIGSKEYRKITKEIANMERAAKRAADINEQLANDIKQIGLAGKELAKARLEEDIASRSKAIAGTGDISGIEKFEEQIGDFRKKKLAEIEEEYKNSEDTKIEYTKNATEKQKQLVEEAAEDAKNEWQSAAREGVGAFERELQTSARPAIQAFGAGVTKSLTQAFVDSFQAVKSFQASGGTTAAGAARGISQIQREDFLVFPTQGRVEALKKISSGELKADESEIRDLIEKINQAVISTPGGIPGVSAFDVERTVERVLAGTFGSNRSQTGLQAPNIQNFFNIAATDAASFLDKNTQQQIEGLQIGKGV